MNSAEPPSPSASFPAVPAADGPAYERRLAHDYFVRIHMSLILMAVTVSGVLTSKGLLDLGVRSLRLRFPLAVLTSYVVFLLLVRIWIWYVTFRRDRQAARVPQNDLAPAAGFGAGLGVARRKHKHGGDFDLDFDGGSGGGGF